MTAQRIIEALGLTPHPEGGHFRETFRAPAPDGVRGAATAIVYLLAAGERSHWHRVDAEEIWAFHAGEPIELLISADGRTVGRHVLGVALAKGETPQAVVPQAAWQSARPTGAWMLFGCVVAPASEFAGFEIEPHCWEPSGA